MVPSNGGARYIMSNIDDFTRRVCVYTLKHKNYALETFKSWITLQENQKEIN